MKQILIRMGILVAVMVPVSWGANEGWFDGIAAHPVWSLFYWGFYAAVFFFFLLGIVRPLMEHLSKSDAPLARIFTSEYRRLKQRGRR